MRAAGGTEQKAVALAVVACPLGAWRDLHQPSVAVLAMPGGDAFRDNRAARVPPQVNHLRARIGLLVIVRHGDGIELAHRIVARKDATGVFPRDSGAGLHLRPRNLAAFAFAEAALRDEVVDSALPLLVARIPVLHGRVFHLGMVVGDDFHDGGMELVLVAHRGGAPFEVRDVGFVVRHNEGALELPRVLRIDSEIGGKLHGAAHALRDVNERSVGEDRRVEGGKEVVAVAHHASEILLHQIRVMLHCLAK